MLFKTDLDLVSSLNTSGLILLHPRPAKYFLIASIGAIEGNSGSMMATSVSIAWVRAKSVLLASVVRHRVRSAVAVAVAFASVFDASVERA